MLEVIAAAAVNAAVGSLVAYALKLLAAIGPFIVVGILAAALHWHPHRRRAA